MKYVSVMLIAVWAAVLVLGGCVSIPASLPTITEEPAVKENYRPIQDPTSSPGAVPVEALARTDLAQRLGIAVGQVVIKSVEAVQWPDASLGCPQPEMMYAQVITPGHRVLLEAQGRTYEYHTGGGDILLCEKKK